ncbi:retrovirus-related pol polyprotein from transposon TNT 1-94 [Tanacetum coccineum]
MDNVKGKLDYCAMKVDQNSVNVQDMKSQIRDMVAILDSASIFAKANAKGEKWEKNNPESPKSATDTKEEHKPDVNAKVQEEHLSKNKSESVMIIHTSEEKTSEDEPPSKRPKFEIPREILSPTPLKSIMPQLITPIVINMPKNQDSSTLSKPTDKGKAIGTEEDPIKALIPFLAESRPSPKILDLKSFSSDGGLMTLKNAKAQLEEFRRIELLKTLKLAEYEAKRSKMIKEYNDCITKRLDPLPITKISYIINRSTKDATMRITRNNDPTTLTVYENFALKMLGLTEWIEVHALASKGKSQSNNYLLQSLKANSVVINSKQRKLGLKPPSELSDYKITPEERKRKRISGLVDEVFVTEDIRVPGMHRNRDPPLEPSKCKASEGSKDQLSAPHQLMIKGLADSIASASNLRDIQVRYIVKEVKDYLKTYSPAEMDIRCRGGSHVTNVLEFDEEDFSSWKDRFLIYLDGLEPYHLEILENGPFVLLSPFSTFTNPLPKPQNQWSHADRRLVNQDKKLKRPSETKDTKIAALRLKFNAFKALEEEKVNGTFTRLRILLNDLENNGVSIPQAEESDSDIEEDQRSSREFLADLNAEFHERALLVNQIRFYKRSGRALMVVADEPSVRKVDARSGQWVEITMSKEQKLLSITNSDERKHVLDYTHVDLHYVEDQRKNLLSKYKSLKQEFSSCNEHVPGNIVMALGGTGKRKEKGSSKEIVFTKYDVSTSENNPELPSDLESDDNTQIPLVKGLKDPIQTQSETSPTSQSGSSRSAKGKDKIWYGPCKYRGLKNQLLEDCYEKPKCSTCGSSDHLTKEHPEQIVVKRTLAKLHTQPSHGSSRKAPMIPKPYIPCKYCGFNDHHSDECEFYPGCDLCGSIAHETSDCPKKTSQRKPRIALKQSSEPTAKHMTRVKQYLHRYSKESGTKVVFGHNSSGDTEGYGLVNCNGITFTKVAYVNGLKHNLISISQLCDANFKVLFTKTQGTIFNQNQEVVLIAPRRRDVYAVDLTSYNEEINACFFAKASPSVNWLWHKRLSHLNFKNINNLAKHNLVFGIPSDKNYSACEKGKHHRASFKTKRSFSIYKSLHFLHMDLFGPVKPQTISHNKYTLVIVDEYSRYTWVFCLKKKSDAADCIMSFIRKMENLNKVRVKELRSDNKT